MTGNFHRVPPSITPRMIPAAQCALLAFVALTVTLFGCSGSGTKATPPVVSALTPSQATVASAVKVTGSNFGSSQAAVNGTVTFNGKPATVIAWTSSSIVTDVPTGATTGNVVVTVSGTPSNTTMFTVASGVVSDCGTGSESVLSGAYAYVVSGFMGAGLGTHFARAGSFTANGSGVISGGDEDFNVGTLGDTHHAITTGSYSVGPDYRGCLTLTYGASSTTFRFSLGTLNQSTVAGRGHIIEFDDASNNGSGYRASGILLQQTVGANTGSTLLTNYAFGMEGADPSGGHVALGGTFTLAPALASSNITNGYLDYNDAGSLPFVGTTNAAFGSMSTTGTNISASTGRTIATYSAQSACAATTCTYHWAVYVVNVNQFLLISTDTLGVNTPLVSGRAISTGSATSFNASSVSNADGYILEATGSIAGEAVAQLQQVKFTTLSSTFSTTGWTYSLNIGSITNTPTNALPLSLAGGYSVSTPGRLAFSNNNLVVYLTDPTVAADIAGFVVGIDTSKATVYSGILVAQQATTLTAGRHFLGTSNAADNAAVNQIGAASLQATTQTPVTYTFGGAADLSQVGGFFSATFSNQSSNFNAAGLGTVTDSVGDTFVVIADGSAFFYIEENLTSTPQIAAEVVVVDQ